MSEWVKHVRATAKKLNVSYMCAVSDASKTYKKKAKGKPKAKVKKLEFWIRASGNNFRIITVDTTKINKSSRRGTTPHFAIIKPFISKISNINKIKKIITNKIINETKLKKNMFSLKYNPNFDIVVNKPAKANDLNKGELKILNMNKLFDISERGKMKKQILNLIIKSRSKTECKDIKKRSDKFKNDFKIAKSKKKGGLITVKDFELAKNNNIISKIMLSICKLRKTKGKI
jgi:hypothetical protein